jgi:hypothetical protein
VKGGLAWKPETEVGISETDSVRLRGGATTDNVVATVLSFLV